jgi:hypothetical protein
MVRLDPMTNAKIVKGRTVITSSPATHGWIFRSSLRMRDTRASMATSWPVERSTSYVMFALSNGRLPRVMRTAGICAHLSHPGFVDTKRRQLACSEADDHWSTRHIGSMGDDRPLLPRSKMASCLDWPGVSTTSRPSLLGGTGRALLRACPWEGKMAFRE